MLNRIVRNLGFKRLTKYFNYPLYLCGYTEFTVPEDGGSRFLWNIGKHVEIARHHDEEICSENFVQYFFCNWITDILES